MLALAALAALTADRDGAAAARRAVWTLALLPTAVYCSLAYTESIALLCAIGAAAAAVRGRYLLAGIAAAVGSLARPTGVLVVVLIGLLALQFDARPGARLRRAAAAALPSVAALAAFLGWMAAARGSALLPFEAQRAWDRGQLGIGLVTAAPDELRAGWNHVIDGTGGRPGTPPSATSWCWRPPWCCWAMLWRAEGGIRSPWVAYSVVVLAVPLSSGTLTSMARFSLMAFPLVWPLGGWVGRDPRRVRWAVAAAVGADRAAGAAAAHALSLTRSVTATGSWSESRTRRARPRQVTPISRAGRVQAPRRAPPCPSPGARSGRCPSPRRAGRPPSRRPRARANAGCDGGALRSPASTAAPPAAASRTAAAAARAISAPTRSGCAGVVAMRASHRDHLAPGRDEARQDQAPRLGDVAQQLPAREAQGAPCRQDRPQRVQSQGGRRRRAPPARRGPTRITFAFPSWRAPQVGVARPPARPAAAGARSAAPWSSTGGACR